jgi:hypothetical protein
MPPRKPKKSPPPAPAPEVPEIDFAAGMGEPPTHPAPYLYNDTLDNKGSLCSNKDTDNDMTTGKDHLTSQEIAFLEYYLTGNYSLKESMVLANYKNYHPKYLEAKARKIIERYESQAGGAAKVLRKAGVGEVRVAQMILKLMGDPSARTQLGATELAAKCLQMSQEPRGPAQGVQIIIHTSLAPASGEPQPGPPVLDIQERKPLPPQKKPLQITE